MKHDYDIIVAGGGPAGATAALAAARAGSRVLLIDKRTFPRDKTCGDALARTSLGYLRALGLLENVLAAPHEPIGAVLLGAPGGTILRVDLLERPAGGEVKCPFIVCRRETLDGVLFDAARREADVIEGRAVTGVLLADGAVRGVECGGRRITAGVTIGADGYDSVIARRLGLYRYDPRRWYIAARLYHRGLECPPQTAEVHFTAETLPGFLWIFPCGEGVTNVGLGMIPRDTKRRGVSIRQVYESIAASPRFRARFRRAERLENIRGWTLPTPDFSRTIHGDGFLLAGDAAGLGDPFTGEGIGNAMGSGMIAAQVAAGAVERGDFSAASLRAYPEVLWKELNVAELKLHYRLRSLARHRWLVDFLIARAARHHDVLDWLTGMTARNGALDRKRELTSPLTYLRLLFK